MRERVDLPGEGVEEHLHFDPVTGDAIGLERKMDVEPLLEANKAAFNAGLVNRQSEFRRVASFDPLTVDIFAKRWGVTSNEVIRNEQLLGRLLNDPDLRYFRTLPGKY